MQDYDYVLSKQTVPQKYIKFYESLKNEKKNINFKKDLLKLTNQKCKHMPMSHDDNQHDTVSLRRHVALISW